MDEQPQASNSQQIPEDQEISLQEAPAVPTMPEPVAPPAPEPAPVQPEPMEPAPQPQPPATPAYMAPPMPPSPTAIPPTVSPNAPHTPTGSQVPSLGLWSILISPLIIPGLLLGGLAIARGFRDERERREVLMGLVGLVLSVAFLVIVALIVSN